MWWIMEISFMPVFSDRRQRDLSAAFYLVKNIDRSQSYRGYKVGADV